jgi:hypothetical protein
VGTLRSAHPTEEHEPTTHRLAWPRRGHRCGWSRDARAGATTFVALYLNAAWRAVFPSTISWDAKDAFAKCSSAVANADWPKAPAQACAAMHLCANEAVLSEEERRRLAEMIRKTEGCGEL